MTSHAADITLFSDRANVLTVLTSRTHDIENKASNVFYWFLKNYLKANPEKSHILLTFKEETSIKIEGCIIKKQHI